MGLEGGIHVAVELQWLMRVSGVNDESVVARLPEIADHIEKAFVVMSSRLLDLLAT